MHIDLENLFILSPKHTAIVKEVENYFRDEFSKIKFEEVLFPKIMSKKMSSELKKLSPRLTEEWDKELAYLCLHKNEKFEDTGYRFCHWQCEPFYFYLQSLPSLYYIRFFDCSGWSFRYEEVDEYYRPRLFLRFEATWCSTIKSDDLISQILKIVEIFLTHKKISFRIIQKYDEIANSGEKNVIDIEVETSSGWIEVCGCHLHGRLFLDGLGVGESDYETGCMGISISRIAAIICTQMNL